MMFSIPARKLNTLIHEHETKRSIYRFYTELAASLKRLALFEAMIASLIVSMAALALARFFLLPWYYALPVPALFLIVRVVQIQRLDTLARAEKAFPSFREQLITIRDNFSRTHDMELALEEDVLSRSNEVEAAGFFDPRGFSLRIIAILVLFFVTGFFTQFTYQDIPPFWNDAFEQGPTPGEPDRFNFWQRSYVTGNEDSSDINSTDTLFGDESELYDGTETIPLELEASRDALDLSTSEEVEELDRFERYTPTRLDVSGAEYFEETIPVSKHEIVQNYFRDR